MKNKPDVESAFHELLPPEIVNLQKKLLLKSKGNILVMDDNEMIRISIYILLAGYGFKTYLTSNGSDAIESYRKAKNSGLPFDAVIMDLNIPNGMGGVETIRKLLEIDPDVNAVVSSANIYAPAMTNFREYGFKAVLPKPCSGTELISVLKEILNKE